MNRVHDALQGLARVLVLAAVVLSPWLFGSAQPWAYLLITYLVGIGVGAWLLSLVCGERVKVRAPLFTAALVALLAFVAFQAIPVPASFVRQVAPLSADAQSVRAALFDQIGIDEFLAPEAGAGNGLATVSASAAATRTSLWLLAAYLGALLVMANTFGHWRQLGRAAAVVVASSFLMVVFALAQSFSGARELYWFHEPRFGGAIFGPFTNRNHFAAHIAMAFGLTLGAFLLTLRLCAPPTRPGWRARLAWLSGRRPCHLVLLGFAALLMGATVCATLSRGAMLSLAIAVCVVSGCLAAGRRVPRLGRAAGVLAILVVAAVGWLAWRPVVGRLSTLPHVARNLPTNARTVATSDTLRIFEGSPLFGTGFGTFQHVFPAFQSDGIDIGRWLHAHNDYAQLLAEGGAVGAGLAAAAAALFLWTVRRRLAKVSRRTALFVAGLGVGVVAIALHSLVDYSLHKPANALFLAMLCGMMLAALHLASRSAPSRLWSSLVRVTAVGGLAALTVAYLRDPTELRGDLAFARFYRLERMADRAASASALAQTVDEASAEADLVLRLAKNNPDALCEVASACLWWSTEKGVEPMTRLHLGEQAVRAAALAARAAPSDYEPWLWLARAQAGLGLDDEAALCEARAFALAPPAVRAELLEARGTRDPATDHERVARGQDEPAPGS